jgi:hypothetical protein
MVCCVYRTRHSQGTPDCAQQQSADQGEERPREKMPREIYNLGEGGQLCLGCFRNSAFTEFRMFFLIPYIPYSIRNCPKFRGIMRNSVLRNS